MGNPPPDLGYKQWEKKQLIWNVTNSEMMSRPTQWFSICLPSKTWLKTGILKEQQYRTGKKQKSWRSQIYIKLTQSNEDDDSRKHPLKYHIWSEINNLTLRLEFIAHWAFYSLMQCKICNRFFTILLWPRWLTDLKLLQVCQFMYIVDYIKCLHCQQLFC